MSAGDATRLSGIACAPEPFGLYLILTDPVAGYEHCAEAAVAARVRYLQLRMKSAPRRAIATVAAKLRAITAGSPTRFMVNDDPDLAVAVGADGVHVGQDDEPLAEVQRRCPQLREFGISTHNETQATAAQALAPSYIAIGPVFTTPSKAHPDPTIGLARMGRIVAASTLTTVVIGGIDAQNLPSVLANGATNFAVIRAVCGAADPLAAIRRLQAVQCAFDERGRIMGDREKARVTRSAPGGTGRVDREVPSPRF